MGTWLRRTCCNGWQHACVVFILLLKVGFCFLRIEQSAFDPSRNIIGTSGCPPYDLSWDQRFYSARGSIPPTPRVYGYLLTVPNNTWRRRTVRSGLPAAGDPVTQPHTIIGVAVDGVVIQRSSRPLNRRDVERLDLCGGYRTPTGGYAYRGPPLCLLAALNDTTPSDWKSVAAAATAAKSQASLWPETAEHPSPLIGYAIDGYEIYGPYDESGRLAKGLDSCNAKPLSTQLAGTPLFRYHLTPEFPYIIGCLVGRRGTARVVNAHMPLPTTVDCPPPPRRSKVRRAHAAAAAACNNSCMRLDILSATNATSIAAAVENPDISVWPNSSEPTLLYILETDQANAAIREAESQVT